ncbi:sensor histidine kinase [Deinococcus aquaedulcis]|uniref:sensor histidine kinase n=1 Tax=Deinococcus aquaedulcis TaxID=2840455 RepID=UPI001C838FA0|nr:ATP-binding protein [Deinococcus aquaedulcis]
MTPVPPETDPLLQALDVAEAALADATTPAEVQARAVNAFAFLGSGVTVQWSTAADLPGEANDLERLSVGGGGAQPAWAAQAFGQVGEASVLLIQRPGEPWTAAERAQLRAAMLVVGRALDRATQAEQLAAERAALAAFAGFSEQALRSTDVAALTQRAVAVLRATLGSVAAAYLVPHGRVWRAAVISGGVPQVLADQLRAGLPLRGESVEAALASRDLLFVPHWTAPSLPGVQAFRAVALRPMHQGGTVVGLLAMGTAQADTWTERERSVFSAVGRSLALALDRALQDAGLREENAALHAQARALEAFAQLSADLGTQDQRLALIRRAQEVILSLMPRGFAAYYELQGDHWQVRSQVGQVRSPALQAALDAGLAPDAQSLRLPWDSGEPYYQAAYDPQADGLSLPEAPGALASLPLQVGEERLGVFTVGQFEAQPWTAGERTLLLAVTQSLTLALGRARSVQQLQQSAAELERSNQALQAANEELEAFAYSVSHDLRAPVRHIAGFADLLSRALDDDTRAQPKVARALQVITDAATQMNALIDAMLNLSRAGRQELRLAQVDLGALTRSILAELQPEVQGRQVAFEVGALPTVYADPALLRQVLANLLGNAVKYTARCEHARIEVWAEERAPGWTVHVRDNGVGFDPRYSHKLFGVFQRLHRAEEFGGSGVGLANVRRILQRHGGTWSAQGQPGQGATFSFTLPRPAN